MEIGKIKPTAEVEYQVKVVDKDGKELPPQPLKLTVHFMGMDRGVDYIGPGSNKKISDFNHAMIADAIEAWDLTIDGEPVPVNDTTKALYVPHICARQTVDGQIVGYEIMALISDSGNFLKN
jgi:hypothetical protein